MKRSIIIGGMIMVLMAGCATSPKTALTSKALKSGHVIYFEQSDRIPKDVLLAAHKGQDPMVASLSNIPEELVGKFLEEILKVVPELAKSYSQERMYNALIGRRMLFVGYDSPEQLKEIEKIVDRMGASIEYVTPQTGPEAGVRAVK